MVKKFVHRHSVKGVQMLLGLTKFLCAMAIFSLLAGCEGPPPPTKTNVSAYNYDFDGQNIFSTGYYDLAEIAANVQAGLGYDAYPKEPGQGTDPGPTTFINSLEASAVFSSYSHCYSGSINLGPNGQGGSYLLIGEELVNRNTYKDKNTRFYIEPKPEYGSPLDTDKMRLGLFVGCKTGVKNPQGERSVPQMTVVYGAKCTIGFEDFVQVSTDPKANTVLKFTQTFWGMFSGSKEILE